MVKVSSLRISTVLFGLVVGIMSCQAWFKGNASGQIGTDWRLFKAGQYRGIRLGRDHIGKLIRVLGNTSLLERQHAEGGAAVYDFVLNASRDGRYLSAEVDPTGIVHTISLRGMELSIAEAGGRFGPLMRVRYSIATCARDSESAPMYEDANGDQVLLVAMGKGITLWPDKDVERVSEIVYSVKPPRGERPACVDAQPKKP